MMLIAVLLTSVLFIAGLINSLFYIPRKKINAWFYSYFLKNTKTSSSSPSANEREMGKGKQELKRVFATFDKNGDGFITNQELKDSLKGIGMVTMEDEVEEMIKFLDFNGDGLIDIDEFCEFCNSMVRREKEREERRNNDINGGEDDDDDDDGGEMELKEAFDIFDGNRDGLITEEELGMVLTSLGLQEGDKMEDCKEMINKVDLDGDGKVNFDEFKVMMKARESLILISV